MNQINVIEAKIIRHLEFAVTFADGLTGAMYQAIKQNGERLLG